MRRHVIVAVALAAACSSTRPTSFEDAGPSGDAARATVACLASGADCALSDAVDRCCNGTVCTRDVGHPETATCLPKCFHDADCPSACCTVLADAGAPVCAPASVCAPTCLAAGLACATNVNGCCEGSTCVSASDGTTCAAFCTVHEQCKSLCCAPLKDSTVYVCSPPTFCH